MNKNDHSRQPILIVDDNPVNLKSFRVLLNGEGYDAHIASDAEEGTRRLAELHPPLILMDIQLPGVNGLELTRRLKSNPATLDITALGLIAYATKAAKEKFLAAGCDGYIGKPIDARTLPGIIRRHLQI